MKPSDIVLTLLLLNLSNDKVIKGRTRFQKLIYILQNEDEIPFSFHYKPYFYGPYSEELAEFIKDIEAIGLIEEEKEIIAPGIYQYNYKLTDSGLKYADKFLKTLKDKFPELIEKFENKILELKDKNVSEIVKIAKDLRISH